MLTELPENWAIRYDVPSADNIKEERQRTKFKAGCGAERQRGGEGGRQESKGKIAKQEK